MSVLKLGRSLEDRTLLNPTVAYRFLFPAPTAYDRNPSVFIDVLDDKLYILQLYGSLDIQGKEYYRFKLHKSKDTISYKQYSSSSRGRDDRYENLNENDNFLYVGSILGLPDLNFETQMILMLNDASYLEKKESFAKTNSHLCLVLITGEDSLSLRSYTERALKNKLDIQIFGKQKQEDLTKSTEFLIKLHPIEWNQSAAEAKFRKEKQRQAKEAEEARRLADEERRHAELALTTNTQDEESIDPALQQRLDEDMQAVQKVAELWNDPNIPNYQVIHSDFAMLADQIQLKKTPLSPEQRTWVNEMFESYQRNQNLQDIKILEFMLQQNLLQAEKPIYENLLEKLKRGVAFSSEDMDMMSRVRIIAEQTVRELEQLRQQQQLPPQEQPVQLQTVQMPQEPQGQIPQGVQQLTVWQPPEQSQELSLQQQLVPPVLPLQARLEGPPPPQSQETALFDASNTGALRILQ
jgi:hypothetical protein